MTKSQSEMIQLLRQRVIDEDMRGDLERYEFVEFEIRPVMRAIKLTIITRLRGSRYETGRCLFIGPNGGLKTYKDGKKAVGKNAWHASYKFFS